MRCPSAAVFARLLLSGIFSAISLLPSGSARSQAGAASPPEAARTGSVGCLALDNGRPAPARFRILQDGAEIVSGRCGQDLELAAGTYEVAVVLEGALGEHEQRLPLIARPAALSRVEVRFETGELLVEIRRQDRASPGEAQLVGGGRRSPLRVGVASRLVAGTYSIEIESRGEKREIAGLSIARGERHVVGVEFGTPPK